MSRRQRVARQPASEKRWLNRDQADLINEARCLPEDHSSSDVEEPIWSIPRQTKPVLEVIRRSGLVTEFENRLRSHPGQKSRLSIDALLLGIILAAGLRQSYRRADICAILNGLPAKVGHKLGLWSPEDTRPITYNMVRKQLKRLENSLAKGWTDANGAPRNLTWFCHTFVAATIPHQYRHVIEAISLDSTVSPTWALTSDYRKEKDALAEYQLASLEEPELPEPELPTRPPPEPGSGS